MKKPKTLATEIVEIVEPTDNAISDFWAMAYDAKHPKQPEEQPEEQNKCEILVNPKNDHKTPKKCCSCSIL